MPKTQPRRRTTPTGPTSALKQRPSALELVTQALPARGRATVADLAKATGLATSTVTKTLTSLENAGRARRDLGGRAGSRRLPDEWTAIAPSPTPAASSGINVAPPTGASAGLGKGELAALVAAYLVGHPAEEIAPTQLAKHLGRSSGAVTNALARLVTTGDAILVSEAPRRFQLAS